PYETSRRLLIVWVVPKLIFGISPSMCANPKNMFMLSALAFYTSLALLPAGARAQTPATAAAQAPDLNFPKAPSPLPAVPRMGLFKPNGVGPFPALVLHHQCGGL